MTIDAITTVTERIIQRSLQSRAAYLDRCEQMRTKGPQRGQLSCSNLAHGYAACQTDDKQTLRLTESANIAIVSAYNDMLSAHQPLETYPNLIKDAVRKMGSTAQFAGGVPAMCDGVTQGDTGMELSLFSRDIIAAATAIALSHNMFDGAICLGVCDKIVPGMLIGALSFGHLPFIFVPAGPMPSGLSNSEKAAVRERYANGEVSAEALLDAESAAYHSPGTCTFYGTANSNQMLMEAMGLHIPGAAFEPPVGDLRAALTVAAAEQVTRITALGKDYRPISQVVDERCIVNALVTLLATGGSTNHAIHWVAIAAAAGIQIDWQDYADLSAATPLLTRIYPNGTADVNHFHTAGGTAFVIRELIDGGYLNADVLTSAGNGLQSYTQKPVLNGDTLLWQAPDPELVDTTIVRSASDPFQTHGGMQLLKGNLGRAVIKVSAVSESHQKVTAPAIIFHEQTDLYRAFEAGELERDFIAVVRYQGPRANGMPELHKLTPYLALLQDKGFKVALVTDGRMSGASGKVPAAIHLSPEAAAGGAIAAIQEGDMIELDAEAGILRVLLDDPTLAAREVVMPDLSHNQSGWGRELFQVMRDHSSAAELGASALIV